MKFLSPLSVVFVALFAIALAGCNSTTPTGSAADDDHDHSEHGAASGQTDMEKMKAELAKLPTEDAASAEKQHICPVSCEMLGTMGAPQTVNVNDQQVWICCDGCREQLLETPAEYLAKLNKE